MFEIIVVTKNEDVAAADNFPPSSSANLFADRSLLPFFIVVVCMLVRVGFVVVVGIDSHTRSLEFVSLIEMYSFALHFHSMSMII